MIDESVDESVISDESVIDKMMLESYGMEVTEAIEKRINESLARTDAEKLFGVDGFLVFNTNETADYVMDNDVFLDYVENDFYPQVDSCSALMIVEQWSPEFIRERFIKALNILDKGEIFRYDDFFREILSLESETELPITIESDITAFEKMPKIVRIF